MTFHKKLGMQSSPMTDLQKSFYAPDAINDGGKVFTPVTVIEDAYLSKSETEQQVFLNLGDARQALAEALERGDAIVKAQDLALFDLGKIRRAVAERIYPTAGLREEHLQAARRNQEDGTPFRKSSIDPVKTAYQAHANDPSTTPADLKAAAAELEALARSMRQG